MGASTYCYCLLYDGVTFKRRRAQSRRAAGLRYAPVAFNTITQRGGEVKPKEGMAAGRLVPTVCRGNRHFPTVYLLGSCLTTRGQCTG